MELGSNWWRIETLPYRTPCPGLPKQKAVLLKAKEPIQKRRRRRRRGRRKRRETKEGGREGGREGEKKEERKKGREEKKEGGREVHREISWWKQRNRVCPSRVCRPVCTHRTSSCTCAYFYPKILSCPSPELPILGTLCQDHAILGLNPAAESRRETGDPRTGVPPGSQLWGEQPWAEATLALACWQGPGSQGWEEWQPAAGLPGKPVGLTSPADVSLGTGSSLFGAS